MDTNRQPPPTAPTHGQLVVDIDRVRSFVDEICGTIIGITQERIVAVATSAMDQGLDEVIAQTVAFGTMYNVAALQVPLAQELMEFIKVEIQDNVQREVVARASEQDKPLIYGAGGQVLNPPGPTVPSNGEQPDTAEARRQLEEHVKGLIDKGPVEMPTECALCACTKEKPCEGGCSWAEPGVCTKCVQPQYRIQAGTLADFVGKEVRLGNDLAVNVVSVEGPIAIIRRSTSESHYLKFSDEAEPMHARTGCIHFTGEVYDGRSQPAAAV